VTTLVERCFGFAIAMAWCVACGDGFSSSSSDAGAPSTPEATAGAGAGNASGTSGAPGAGGGRSPSGGKLGGGTGLPSGGTATGGSDSAAAGGSASSSGGSGTSSGGSVGATGGSDSSTGGSDSSTGGSAPSGGGSDHGGSTSSGATGGTGGDASGTETGGSNAQAGSGSGGTPSPGTGGSSAAAAAGASPLAGAPGSGGSPVIGGCDHQLLANGDFEAGPTPTWGEQSGWPGIEIIVRKDNSDLLAEGVAPYAGNYLAWLGGIPDNEWDHYLVILTQDITLPSTASTLTLSGRRHVTSVDDPSDVFDVAYLEFDNEAGDVVWQAEALTNQDTTDGWVAFESSTNVEPQFRGQKLTFVAYSNTDPQGQTSFFLDDLRLEAGCGR
jgi:hypothetical protein